MKTVIKTYDDLLLEEKRLSAEMASYKILLKNDVAGIKAELNPITWARKKFKAIFTRNNNGPLLNIGLNIGIDLLLRRILLVRMGWLMRVVVPFIVKNYVSHLVTAEHRKATTKKMGKFFGKMMAKVKKAAGQ